MVAPGLVPRKPTDRVKTDRRDALQLAEALRAGTFTPIRVPTREEEAFRDLVRARTAAVEDQMRVRHRVKSALLRWGVSVPVTRRERTADPPSTIQSVGTFLHGAGVCAHPLGTGEYRASLGQGQGTPAGGRDSSQHDDGDVRGDGRGTSRAIWAGLRLSLDAKRMMCQYSAAFAAGSAKYGLETGLMSVVVAIGTPNRYASCPALHGRFPTRWSVPSACTRDSLSFVWSTKSTR